MKVLEPVLIVLIKTLTKIILGLTWLIKKLARKRK